MVNETLSANKNTEVNVEYKILTQKDLLRIFPFGKTKLQQLLRSGALPVVKVGRSYLTTNEELSKWLQEHLGAEIIF